MIRYNTYDLPIEIAHPDGTLKRFEYTKAGWLLRHTDQEGVKKEYATIRKGASLKSRSTTKRAIWFKKCQGDL